MRFTKLLPTGASVQAGAELVEAFGGAQVGGALLPSLGAVSAGGPLVLTGGPRIIGGDGFPAWEGSGSSMVHAKMRRPLVLGTDQWFSFVCVFRKRTSSIDANAIAAFGSDSGSAGNTLMFLAGDSSGANILRFYIQDSGGGTYTAPNPAILTTGAVAVSDMRWHTIALSSSLIDLGGGGTSLRRAYVDGMFEGEGTAAPATLAATTFQHMCANGVVRTTASASVGAFDVALVVPLFGRLDHADLQSLSVNPWQLFRTQKHRPVLRQEAGGTASQDYVGSGYLIFTGAATTSRQSHTNNYVGSGTLTISGSAGVNFGEGGPGTGGGGTVCADAVWVGAPNEERMLYHNGVYYGGGMSKVATGGDMVMWKYTPATGDTQRVIVRDNFQGDDHNNPAMVFLSDGRIAIAYAEHGTTRPMAQVSINPYDITSWGPVRYTYWTQANYSNIIKIGNYYWVCFQPTANRLDYAVRTTDFVTFGSEFCFIDTDSYGNKNPYTTMTQNGPNRVDCCYVTQHPAQGDGHADIYHLYFTETNGAFIPHKADGTVMSMPVRATDGTLVYDSGSSNCVMTQVRIGPDGNPRLLFVRFETSSDHRCMFTRFNGTSWTAAVQIVAMGGGIAPVNEPFYSGLMSFDGNDTNRVYVSVKVGSYHEIQQWETTDNGATWNKTADITSGSTEKNIRPYSVIGHDGIKVFWAQGYYEDYTDYDTDLISIGTTAGTSLQHARPSADVLTGAWTPSEGTLLYSTLDEVNENDAEYITCVVPGSNCFVQLSTITDPLTGNGHVVHVRARAPYGGRVRVLLHDTSAGSRTTLATWDVLLTPLFFTYALALTAAEADSIVNYATLQLSFAPFGLPAYEGEWS